MKEDGNGGRVCRRCGEWKEFSQCVKQKGSKSGRRPLCNDCYNKERKEYWNAPLNRNRKHKTQKRYYKKNRVKIREREAKRIDSIPNYHHKRYIKDKSRSQEYSREYYDKHKDEIKKRVKKWAHENWDKVLEMQRQNKRRKRDTNEQNGLPRCGAGPRYIQAQKIKESKQRECRICKCLKHTKDLITNKFCICGIGTICKECYNAYARERTKLERTNVKTNYVKKVISESTGVKHSWIPDSHPIINTVRKRIANKRLIKSFT